MIRNYLIIFFLLIFAACTNNTVRDYTSLKQKALEIPPDFELTPPVVGEEEVEEAAPTGESAEDIQDIITQDSSTSVPSNADTSSLDEFIDNNFGNEDQNINNSTLPEDPLDEVIEDSLVESNELDSVTYDDSTLDTTDNIGLSSNQYYQLYLKCYRHMLHCLIHYFQQVNLQLPHQEDPQVKLNYLYFDPRFQNYYQ